MNLGQLAFLLQGRFCIPVESLTKVAGMPFGAAELAELLTPYRDEGRGAGVTTIDLGLPQLGGLDRVPTEDEVAAGEGLHQRPGGALVPRLRRLRRAGRRPARSCRR